MALAHKELYFGGVLTDLHVGNPYNAWKATEEMAHQCAFITQKEKAQRDSQETSGIREHFDM